MSRIMGPDISKSGSETTEFLGQAPSGTGFGREQDEKALLRLEVAAYISQMCAELGAMARNSDLSLLSYFLDMATAEAREASQKLSADMHGVDAEGYGAGQAPRGDEART
ncbi:MAG: hypothetical protein HEQ16_10075 [Bosea sp.]|jgi:hypothetical protein|nr:hypothetical protein [Bosea sp. (in: a-proteobacteria)]